MDPARTGDAASSADVNQPESGFRLRDGQLAWLLDGSSTPAATGAAAALDLNPIALGPHTLTLRGTDDQGIVVTQAIAFTVAWRSISSPRR